MSTWAYGGSGDLFPDLTWDNRPSFAGSEAPERLQDAFVATVLAIKDMMGALREGSCFYINLAAAPLVQKVLGEPVKLCAGYGAFIGNRGKFECGFQFRPDKWADWIDVAAGAHLSPIADVHCWLESATRIIDLSTGDTMGDPDCTWPPLVYWKRWRFPKSPLQANQARKDGPTILLWRNAKAIEMVTTELLPIVAPIASHALEILREQLANSARHVALRDEVRIAT